MKNSSRRLQFMFCSSCTCTTRSRHRFESTSAILSIFKMNSQAHPSVTQVQESNSSADVNATNPTSASGKRAWQLHELTVLIAAKRADNEKTFIAQGRDRIRTSETRWIEIQSVLAKSGVMRTALQSKKRWEKFMTDFKKVYDFDLKIGSGQQTYYEIGSAERSAKKLPKLFPHELFNLMLPWVPEARAVNPEGNRVMDTGDLEDAPREVASSSREGPPMHDVVSGSENEYTENIHTPDNNAEEEFDPTDDVVENSSMAPPPTSQSMKRKAKGRRESLDEQFKKHNDEFLGFLDKDSEKKARLDEASLNWEKEKTDRFLAQQEYLTNSMSGAINNMATAFTKFAAEMSKRL